MKVFCWGTVLALAALTASVLLARPEDAPSVKGMRPPGGYPVVERPRDPPTSPELELVAHLALPGPMGDLWAHKDTVYVGNWGGPHGVKLIDIANPAQPTLIGTLPVRARTSYEDLMVIAAETPAFKGDLLVVGLQGATTGVEFWDVTNRREPKLLDFFRTSHVHELHLMQRGERVLALLACLDDGLRIVDATDPTQPKLLSTWQILRALRNLPLWLHGVWPVTLCHSVSTSADGNLAYVSYWDHGAAILDISDPARPRFLGRTVYPVTEEGNTHSAVEADGGRLLITTDEDWDPAPAANTIRVMAPASLAGVHPAIELAITRQLAETGPVRGEVVYVGSALPGTDLKADPKGKIALLDLGRTDSARRNQVLRLQEAGAVAVLFSAPLYFRTQTRISAITVPGVSLWLDLARELKKVLEKGERVEVELTAGPATWGFVRF